MFQGRNSYWDTRVQFIFALTQRYFSSSHPTSSNCSCRLIHSLQLPNHDSQKVVWIAITLILTTFLNHIWINNCVHIISISKYIYYILYVWILCMTLHPHRSYARVVNDNFTTHIKSHVILLHCIYTNLIRNLHLSSLSKLRSLPWTRSLTRSWAGPETDTEKKQKYKLKPKKKGWFFWSSQRS